MTPCSGINGSAAGAFSGMTRSTGEGMSRPVNILGV